MKATKINLKQRARVTGLKWQANFFNIVNSACPKERLPRFAKGRIMYVIQVSGTGRLRVGQLEMLM